MAVGPNALVSLSSGLRSGMRRNKLERIEDEDRAVEAEDRQARLSDAARRRTFEDEDRAYARTQRTRQDQEYERATAARATADAESRKLKNAQRLHSLAQRLEQDPQNWQATLAHFNTEAGDADGIPDGATFDPATGSLLMPGQDGKPTPVNVRQLRENIAAELGIKPEKPEAFTLSEGQIRFEGGKEVARGAPKSSSGDGGLQPVKLPNGTTAYRLGSSTTLLDANGQPLRDGVDAGPKPITPSEIRLRRGAFRSALDSRSKDPISGRSNLTGEQRQQFGAIADRMIQKYGTATPGEDDLAQIIVTRMSAVPTLEQLRAEELESLKASGKANTGLFQGWGDGVNNQEAARTVATETAKARREVLLQEAEAEIEQQIDDIATAYYGAGGAQPTAAAPAAAPTAAAPSGRGATLRDVLTPDRLKGAPAAVQAVKVDPNLFTALTSAPSSPDKLVAARFPDGKVYYLAGDELREFVMPQQTQ